MEDEDKLTEKIANALPRILEIYENREFHELGLTWVVNGFFNAEYSGYDDTHAFIKVTWGLDLVSLDKKFEMVETHMLLLDTLFDKELSDDDKSFHIL